MKLTLIVAALLGSVSLGISQTAAPDAAELTKLLNEFLAGASRNDPAVHERFWAEELIYTGSGGIRRSKADVLRNVREAAQKPNPEEPPTTYTSEDVRINQFGDTAIVAFRLVGRTEKKDGAKEVQNYLNTGTFLKRGGKWQVVAWQATKMAPPEDEAKK